MGGSTSPDWKDIDQTGIKDRHLIIIAECILAWAQCENQLRALLTALEGRPLHEGAKDYQRLSPEDSWKKIKRELRTQRASEGVLETVQHNRSESRTYYETRKIVTHAGCTGTWKKDPDYLAFSAFEPYEIDQLALYWVPLDDLIRSTSFARASSKMASELLRSLGH